MFANEIRLANKINDNSIKTSLSLTKMSSCMTKQVKQPSPFKAYALPLQQEEEKKPSSAVILLNWLAYNISIHLNLFLLPCRQQKTKVGLLVLVNRIRITEVGSLVGTDKQHSRMEDSESPSFKIKGGKRIVLEVLIFNSI